MNAASACSFPALMQTFPPGSLVAICGRPGSALESFLDQLALSVDDESPDRVLVFSDRCGTTSIGCSDGRCLREKGLTGAVVETRYRPGLVSTEVLLSDQRSNSSFQGVLIDAVPIEQRSLSRNFDSRHYLAQLKRWAQRQGGLALVRSNLSRRLERRGNDFKPRWRDMPSSLRREADGAVMLYHPATYFVDAWTQGWHEIVCMVFGDSRILRLNGEAPIRGRNHWALSWKPR